MEKYDDSIELQPIKDKDGEKTASEKKPKVLFDKTAYDEPVDTNPMDKVNPDLHSK